MKELTLIFFGIIFLAVGITTVLKKKFGPEEGMRGVTFHGKIAVFAGSILIILGIFSLVLVIFTK